MLKNRFDYWKDRPKNNDSVNGGRIFIDELLSFVKDNNLSEQHIIDNMMTVFFAAFETSSLTVSYTIILLAMHPKVYDRVEDEIAEHYKPGQEIDQDFMRKLTYLDMVIKETLRVFPSAPSTSRIAVQDTYLGRS